MKYVSKTEIYVFYLLKFAVQSCIVELWVQIKNGSAPKWWVNRWLQETSSQRSFAPKKEIIVLFCTAPVLGIETKENQAERQYFLYYTRLLL